jgi:DNA polymerase III alpha subunit
MEKYLNDPIFSHNDAALIAKNFKRKCPKIKEYIERLQLELNLIIKKNLTNNILRVCEILDLLGNIPHIIRGSSGSSLVCYLLGITNIDPIKEKICFARFLNNYRTKLPDFDIDIPHIKHDYAFKLINKKWGNKVARISNHVCYGQKSAIRKAIKELGHNKRVDKKNCNLNFFKDDEMKKKLKDKTEELFGTFKNYSLHCGGIIFDEKGFSSDLIINNSETIQQVKYNKDDIDNKSIFKVDILSNRGLTQLFDISKMEIENYPDNDEKVIKLLCSGKNIGLTFCESPGMKKVLVLNQPKNIYNLAECLSLIRPMASESKSTIIEEESNINSSLKFDDDAILYIKSLINCDEGLADKYRRAFAKSDWKQINLFMWLIRDNPQKEKIKKKLLNLRKYSFCKSHAISYAKLVWALAYNKVYKPKEFWLSTLNNCHTMYRSWVHFREAKLDSNINLELGDYPFIIKNNTIYPANNKIEKEKLSKKEQLLKYGYWKDNEFFDDCTIQIINKNTCDVKFVGLIACSRWCRKWISGKYKFYTYITIGYKNGYYMDLKITDKWASTKGKILVEGSGKFIEVDKNVKYGYIEVNDLKFK